MDRLWIEPEHGATRAGAFETVMLLEAALMLLGWGDFWTLIGPGWG